MDLTLVPYQHSSKSQSQSPLFNLLNVKYKECMKNHAASIGGHANDGCGEFMPPSDHGFTCAACGCHRNFHRREGSSVGHHLLLPSPPPPPAQPHQPIFLYNAGGPALKKLPDQEFEDDDDDDGDDDHDRRSETPEREDQVHMEFGGRSDAAAKSKRFRTKFTAEQKEKMLVFAEKIGWRISKHDDVALNQFCNEIGVRRNVLKVWMHNNKNAHRRRDATTPSSAVPPPPPPPSVAPPPQSVHGSLAAVN